ncbi:uncharacterized protein APUU_80892A [Aspergillus puulaauensis]|uniref:Aldehyde dehydrogenase domain-containing protein n=1 Tax=Aspergillus puulaauensis TaxID=1220207 RepID=A0A7R7XZV3_9EURO|nr:uncharacterized protein APUU_80892A [Aspergillus puulaauensis]BCS30589.1 hypothetical protein APUU_80892A [Aspergillus puulaauensis]
MQLHHLVTGSYTNTTLFLLAFDSVSRTLGLDSTVPGYGLHQFVSSNSAKDRIHATAMSEPPRLFSWSVSESFTFNHLDTVNIRNSSSACYVSDNGQYAFSAGGPTAHVHALDQDGGIGQLIDEIDLLPSEEIKRVDKTRNAVLYGAHAFDVNVNNKAFIPDLGMNSIYMYDIAANGSRNTYPSKDGRLLYVITEHTQWLDVYEIGDIQLKHVQRGSAIPNDFRGEFTFRGNTVQPSRDEKYLFTSSRSRNSPGANGYVADFALNETGYLAEEEAQLVDIHSANPQWCQPSYWPGQSPRPRRDPEDLNRSVDAAQQAFRKWSKTFYDQRCAALMAFGDVIEANQDSLACFLTMEVGLAI